MVNNEFEGYQWKSCPCFDYRSILQEKRQEADVKRFRLITGVFLSAEERIAAKKCLLSVYNWVLYEKEEYMNYNPPFRLLTGTFINKDEADMHAKVIREGYGWTVYVIDA